VIAADRARWLAFLSFASAWTAGVAGLAVLPLSVSAFAVAESTEGAPQAAALMGWLALLIGGALVAYAAAAATVAVGLWQRRRWARAGALGLGFTNVFLPPFGTAFGVYALWTLFVVPERPISESGE
jgi:uncharacterized membrane protein (DUF2068 family)